MDIDKAQELWAAYWAARQNHLLAKDSLEDAREACELRGNIDVKPYDEALHVASEIGVAARAALMQCYATADNGPAILERFLWLKTKVMRLQDSRVRYSYLSNDRQVLRSSERATYRELAADCENAIYFEQEYLDHAQIELDKLTGGIRVSEPPAPLE